MIDGLPRNSHYVDALSSDDEFADAVVAAGADQGERRRTVRMSDYSMEVERLTDLVDRIGDLVQVVIAVAGGKPKRLRGAPRPQTAIERARARARERKHRMVVARVLPGR